MKKITVIIMITFLISCTSVKKLFYQSQLTKIEISNNSLRSAITRYNSKMKNENSDHKYMIILMAEDIYATNENVYINHTLSVSDLYRYPISGYTILDGKPVLIYSKSIGYLNPRKYPAWLLNDMQKYLDNDWNLIKRENGIVEFTGRGIMNHSSPWEVRDEVIDSTANKKFNKSEFLYNKIDFTYFEIDDLSDLRIIEEKSIN